MPISKQEIIELVQRVQVEIKSWKSLTEDAIRSQNLMTKWYDMEIEEESDGVLIPLSLRESIAILINFLLRPNDEFDKDCRKIVLTIKRFADECFGPWEGLAKQDDEYLNPSGGDEYWSKWEDIERECRHHGWSNVEPISVLL